MTPILQLAQGESRKILPDANVNPVGVSELANQVALSMAKALAAEGLYPREATAMVNTWKDSWFTEDGVRVLYVLPRAWTDATLPLTLDPPPRELVRVMVGRAEVITPSLQKRLRDEISRAAGGDVAGAAQTAVELKKLGRFAEAALQLATKGMDAKSSETAWTILAASRQPPVTIADTAATTR